MAMKTTFGLEAPNTAGAVTAAKNEKAARKGMVFIGMAG
jgi:hypothetical protein